MSALKKQRITANILLLTTMSSAIRLMAPVKSSVVNSNFPLDAPPVTIGTHDGSFHCDEALAIAMLKILPKYANAPVVRTRNASILQQCSIVVDVGAEYKPEEHRYDHHQREFIGTLEPFRTKLSSAGLVYKHFGRDILREILQNVTEGGESALSDSFIEICFEKVYKDFMEHIDAIDNGVSIADTPSKYHVSTTLSARVGELNPAWNEEQTADVYNSKFVDAMMLTGSEFIAKVEKLSSSWWPARSIVQRAIDERNVNHSSGQIVVLEKSCPWKDHLFDIEEEQVCLLSLHLSHC